MSIRNGLLTEAIGTRIDAHEESREYVAREKPKRINARV